MRFEMTDEGDGAPETPPHCVICRVRPQTAHYRPFCSRRCSEIDLHRWLGGVYAIPAEPDEEEDGTSPASESEDR